MLNDSTGFFIKSITSMLKYENFFRNLHLLTADASAMCTDLLATKVSRVEHSDGAEIQWCVVNLFDDDYTYVGADEVAEDRALGDYSLSIFQDIEARASTAKVYVSWLLAPGHYLRLWEDSLQFLIDSGAQFTKFVINALFGGQVNTGINAAWFPVFLCGSSEWKARAFAEVDSVIERHRISPGQKSYDILDTLSVDNWQTCFPVIDQCLRECVPLAILGAPLRKNTTGFDVAIGNGEVIPNGAHATYLIDLVHFNPDIYPDPQNFDPGRYDPDRAEDKKVPHAFLGWGVGRHPCHSDGVLLTIGQWE
ncbi:cytochrome P450 [Thozetella sp. PMI_491]|nr:cytochrome P450 [Thozetella sp. PMI_491]